MICKNCGALLGEGHESCPRCGTPLMNATAESAATPSRHADSPWKRPARPVSTLPPEPGRKAASRPAAPSFAPQGAPDEEKEPISRGASRPRRMSDAPDARGEQPSRPSVRRADEQPASRTRTRSRTPSPASRPERLQTPDFRAPLDARREQADGQAPRVRMVKRHRYRAIEPEYSEFATLNWIRLLIVTAVSVAFLAVGAYVFLTKTSAGTTFCARRGWDTTAEAYHQVGREAMSEGSISRAVQALEIAQTKNPDDLETLIDLGRAYMGINRADRAELAYMHAIQCWPAYPESYRYLIEIMLDDGRNYEALQCINLAVENTGDTYFSTLLKQIKPAAPSVSILGGTFTAEFDLTMSAEDDAKIYYTTLGEDPTLEGTLYTGPIHLAEGSWRIQAVAAKGGMFSNVNAQTYVVNKPNPDAPKATLASDTYDSVRTVSLRCGKDVVAMYYTMDGTAPTVESKLYEGPIKLRVGKTTLRAIAVNVEGKTSNEMVVEYECKGNAGKAFNEKDIVDKLTINGTTRESFVSTYGQPSAEQDDGSDELGAYTRLQYVWGSAVFLDRQNGKDAVLVELVTASPDMKYPRSTRIGMRVEDVLSAYRDVGGEENTQGVRNLYTMRTSNTGSLGILTRLDEDDYHIGYYFHLESGAWLELSYYSEGGLIVRVEWSWYMPA